MSNIEVKNVEGQAAGTVELSSDVFGIEPNIPVVHQVVTAYEASLRQGTHSVKNRHNVSGGGRKPYRQKGTGRARQGSTRAGQWTGSAKTRLFMIIRSISSGLYRAACTRNSAKSPSMHSRKSLPTATRWAASP